MQETPASKRITLLETEDYSVDLEYGSFDGRDYAILHLPFVKKFTKSVYLDMKIRVEEVWEFLSTIHYNEMFCGVDKGDELMKKFATKMGFIHLGDDGQYAIFQYKEYK